ncbi:unnamed protein product [Cuscuta epithymum]|uniref:Uncharacterized protein n=1 Tax=Cuscuta epithymum TaxID=186058 RepID=A0AAV0FF98_9ASTE|nr:unnamed protein product [Cuscuta epithymum]
MNWYLKVKERRCIYRLFEVQARVLDRVYTDTRSSMCRNTRFEVYSIEYMFILGRVCAESDIRAILDRFRI